ncbi:hypothetical protein DH2020_021373 [Rehmannia glutinosa]|uniref:Kinesin motor domain-containing protein n=1 Tax=Rehmannia glutinosa TaxID=99300 RepID=A0ABR0WAS9_REHGL
MEASQRRGGGGGGMVPDIAIANAAPLSEDEVRLHTPVVVSCNDSRREVCAIQNIANKQIDRTFLFDKNAEYSMKVTFLELYNEEITDLLAPEECPRFTDDKSKKPIALMEDGKGGECTPEGEEMIKCGKLNLVDLAGLENISRSGAREGRAREAGEINKSLLTLGRVINTLVEHSGHIPYRDSKLTRLLRDSLGGENEACIIATISPSIHCLEETLSTLDYAHRAKNIKNKPEVSALEIFESYQSEDDEICSNQGFVFEIDRLKQEVYAAREKNGSTYQEIVISKMKQRKRYVSLLNFQAMSEKIERMELDLDSRDKQFAEVQELYNSQQQLTVELSDKLEKSEKKLQETEHALLDLEERHRQANATIKEKEYVISNLLKSGRKALVERALELLEQNWRTLHQMSQICLPRLLEILHKAVASSTRQQEIQLKEMEEDMHSFVSTKTQATEELRGHLDKLKTMYGSGIKALDDLAGELDSNSHSTFGRLNSEVSKHSSALEELFKGITSEADTLLQDLQDSLHSQERKLIAYSQQQQEMGMLQTWAKLWKRHRQQNDQKLSELEKKFEECAADEEKQLLAKVAELLAGSNARKKKLVKCAIDGLRENAANRTNKLQQEMSIMQETTCSIKAEWTSYTQSAESHYVEDTSSVETGKEDMEVVLHKCLEQAKLGYNNGKMLKSPCFILRRAMLLHSALEDADTGSKNLLSSIDRRLHVLHGFSAVVDQPSCSTPRKRPINPPSIASIEELRTPSFEELLKSFWDAKSSTSKWRRKAYFRSGRFYERLQSSPHSLKLKGE